MLRPVDVERGERYRLVVVGEVCTAEFIKSKSCGQLVFEREQNRSRVYIDRNVFVAKRANGEAVRLRAPEDDGSRPSIEPLAFEPDMPGDTKDILARKRKYRKAVTQQYYLRLIDDLGVSRSIAALENLLASQKQQHSDFGLAKAPGASTLIQLYRLCGTPGNRPLHLFLNGSGGDRKSYLWDPFILERKAMMIEMYYAGGQPMMSEKAAKAWFKGQLAEERVRRGPLGASLARVPDSTLRRWLIMSRTPENVERREGKVTAHRQMVGIKPHQQAMRPLQCVVMDHTQVDLHLVLLDELGEVRESIYRPWLMLVVDVYTRMILAANLTMEFPSLYTLMEGLKQTVAPKPFLDHFATSTAYYYACDGWGLFSQMLVDNDLSNVGQSMRTSAFAVGLDVSFAGVKNPETKSIVERTFGTLNTEIWHQAHGGVRQRPGVLKDEDPRIHARFTLEEAQEMLWEYIVKVYHVDVHGGIGMAPARKWMEAYKLHHRPTIDDMREIDEVFAPTVKCTLTRSGVRHGKQVFHQSDIVSRLINDLLPYNKKALKGRNKTQSVSIPIRARPDKSVRFLTVYNHARGVYENIPNLDKTMVGTYAEAEVRSIENNIANESFHPADAVDISRAKQLAKIAPREVATGMQSSSEAGNLSSGRTIAIRHAEQSMLQRTGAQRGVGTRKKNAAEARKRAKREGVRHHSSGRMKDVTVSEACDLPALQPPIPLVEAEECSMNTNVLSVARTTEGEDKAALLAEMRAKLGLAKAAG